MKALKFLAIAMIAGVALALLGIELLTLGCNTQLVKDRLSLAVLESRQRTLKIDGDLSLSFTLEPAVVIRLGHVSLSERDSRQIFASVEGAQAALRLWPLLSRQIVVERIELTGLKATLVRRADGTLNIADLLLPGKPDKAIPQFAIAGLRIADGELGWRDESNDMTLTLGGIQIDNGRLANAAKDVLQLSARLHTHQVDDIGIKLKVRYDYDLQAPRFAFGQLDVQIVSPQVGGLRDVDIRVALDEPVDLGGDARPLKIGKLAMQFSATAGTARLAGKFDTPLVTYLPAQRLELEEFTGEFSIADAQRSLPPLSFSGNLRGDFAQQSATGNLAGQFADSHFSGKFDVIKFSPVALAFDIDIDRLDLDRYLPASGSTGGGKLDPDLLDRLDLRGTLHIGELGAGRAKMRNVRLALMRAADGRLELAAPTAGR